MRKRDLFLFCHAYYKDGRETTMNAKFTIDEPISYELLRNIEKFLEEKYGINEVVIANYKVLEA